MNKLIFAIASCVVVATLTGCALTTDRITLEYNPQAGVSRVSSASNIAVNVQVIDQRQDKGKVSSKKNGYGMELAPIIATEEVSETVRRAIEQELTARGFQLGADAAPAHIGVELARFDNDFKMGFFAGDAVADLIMSITVKSREGEALYARQIVAQGVESDTQLASGKNARLALNRALEYGIRDLFEDQAFVAALVSVPPSN